MAVTTERRDVLGRAVREEWVAWAQEQADPKPSWLTPWEELGEQDREVDRRIGVRLYAMGRTDREVAVQRPDDESWCRRCGGRNCVWSAPSPLWNEVMRGGDINGPWRWNVIICPPCFAELAEAAGITATGWKFTADKVLVPLTLVTPSGRVWSEVEQLWIDREQHEGGIRMIYVIQMPNGTSLHVQGSDKNDAWAKVGFEGLMTDSMTQEEFDHRYSQPTIID